MARNETTTALRAPENGVTVRITPVIEREFRRRDVFPELRLEKAARIDNGATGVHTVSIERAREILSDAQTMQRQSRELPRGIPKAYRALADNVGRTVKQEERRGLWDDPGMPEARRRAVSSPARLQVGDNVLYFQPGGEYGSDAVVVADYDMYAITAENGPFITDDGKRLEYGFGYVVKVRNSEKEFFCAAHCLTRDDCKPSHLRLVASA